MATKKHLVKTICSDLEITQSRISSLLDNFNCDVLDEFHKVNLEMLQTMANKVECLSYDLEMHFEDADDLENMMQFEDEIKKERKVKREVRKEKLKKARRKK